MLRCAMMILMSASLAILHSQLSNQLPRYCMHRKNGDEVFNNMDSSLILKWTDCCIHGLGASVQVFLVFFFLACTCVSVCNLASLIFEHCQLLWDWYCCGWGHQGLLVFNIEVEYRCVVLVLYGNVKQGLHGTTKCRIPELVEICDYNFWDWE